uniref:Reverse transcriptase/retrotransposon-derived protein RNase H-like domain-containing protein n=1 Tax=Athene cunicularia TaxID=194338 RepID=A0A663MKB2_ATHCN
MDLLLAKAEPIKEVEPICWGPEKEKSFQAMNGSLALGLPDYSKTFELFVHENKGVASGVLTQKLGLHCCPVAYYSTKLDPVVTGNNSCVTAIVLEAEPLHPPVSAQGVELTALARAAW